MKIETANDVEAAIAAPEILTVAKNNTEVVACLVESTPGRWRVYRWNDEQCVNWMVTLGRWFPSRFDALRFIQEQGYDVTETQSDRVYRFRAECQHDVDELRRLLGLKLHTITMINEPPFPDIEVELEISLSLEELRDAMRQVVDGHVMVQTVARSEEYTGERDFEV